MHTTKQAILVGDDEESMRGSLCRKSNAELLQISPFRPITTAL